MEQENKEIENWWEEKNCEFELLDLYEEHRTKQCYMCAGWAIECSCDNEFPQGLKNAIAKLLKMV